MRLLPSSSWSWTSSPTLFAGQKPITALARSHFSSTIRFSIACASRNSSLAWVPTMSSVRMAGKRPASSQALKNGDQSMKGTSSVSG